MGVLNRLRSGTSRSAAPGSRERALVEAAVRAIDHDDYSQTTAAKLRATAAFGEAREAPPEEQIEVVLAAFKVGESREWHVRDAAHTFVSELLKRKLPWDEAGAVRLVEALRRCGRKGGITASYGPPVNGVLRTLERTFGTGTLPASLHGPIRDIKTMLAHYADASDRKAMRRIEVLLGEAGEGDLPHLGDLWGQAVLAAHEAEGELGGEVLRLAATASGTKPTGDFKAAREGLAAADREGLGRAVGAMLTAAAGAVPVSKANCQVPPETGDVLRGLAWLAEAADTDDAGRGAAAMAIAGWQKVPNYGPLSRKAASACIGALAAMPDAGVQHLGRVRAMLKQATAVADVEQAIDAASERLGIPRAEFEERVVPTFDLGPDGVLRRELGKHTAEVAIGNDLKAKLVFITANGKRLKSVPAAVKAAHPEAVAELKALAKDVTTMAQAQRLRLERLLLDERDWPLDSWRERYLEHPVVAPVARRLIWTVGGTTCLWRDGVLVDADGAAVEPDAGARVALWHPVAAGPDEVLAWRRALEESETVQPFKQAHREIYLLTDAERETRVYSNRFAAHVLRQHQFAALARGRGWRYALQGAFDSPDEEATLQLRGHGLAVSFYVERPWGDEEDWNDSGIFNHVLTDQVRFDDGRDVVALDTVPARVFSEIMRDVDLFVGVASIGNDPTWEDGGRDQRWDRYWQSYSFGELGAQAEVRRDLLTRLLPMLKIADKARLEGRFLVVEGTERRYKIHLGSGNILMSPNDEYLCIVPGRDKGQSDVFLPFEGDQVLSIILSKAMLLARDDTIEDRTILSQIRRR